MTKMGMMVRSAAPLLALLLTAGADKTPWDESNAGTPLDLTGSSRVYAEEFDAPLSLKGPILWAKQHADVGLEKYDAAGGGAYSITQGILGITAYKDSAGVIRSGNVQSINANQAYQGYPIKPGINGFTCTACYWEARARFPQAYGTWAAFWLLTPDNPAARGHLEFDGIEFYGKSDPRGHHHSWHKWDTTANGSHVWNSNYVGTTALADYQWHTYGVDLRGKATVNGAPAGVVYFDGKEISRYPLEARFFSQPFYYLLTLSINPNDKNWTFPQTAQFEYVRVWK